MAPRDIATKIVDNVPENQLIQKLEVAGPGFVNIFLRKIDILFNTKQKIVL